MRSCNPWFYEIGYQMYESGRIVDITEMAEGFGLGSATGIEQVAEDVGNLDVPVSVDDAVQQAIGQSTLLVTPLQVARFIAAIGNGGTLYRPQLVEQIVPVEGDPVTVFEPETMGTLPIQPFRLEVIQQAMVGVVADERGTANFRLRGLRIPAAGKTGTAESGSGDPHAWFAGYTTAADATGQPDIAIAVVLAPVFQRIVETYYYGTPQTIYWFESTFGVTETPTPLGGIPTETPEPE
jgi:penicillin-binding protein 2